MSAEAADPRPPWPPSLQGLSSAEVAKTLGLLPHREGGHFRESHRSPIVVPTPAGMRALSTAILYLLTVDDPSCFHRLRFDEIWFFHAGSPVEMVLLDPLETYVIGAGKPQALAPGGRWVGARVTAAPDELPGVAPGGAASPATTTLPDWALVSCVVSPGFEYDDFEAGSCDLLLPAHPEAADYILALTGGEVSPRRRLS